VHRNDRANRTQQLSRVHVIGEALRTHYGSANEPLRGCSQRSVTRSFHLRRSAHCDESPGPPASALAPAIGVCATAETCRPLQVEQTTTAHPQQPITRMAHGDRRARCCRGDMERCGASEVASSAIGSRTATVGNAPCNSFFPRVVRTRTRRSDRARVPSPGPDSTPSGGGPLGHPHVQRGNAGHARPGAKRVQRHQSAHVRCGTRPRHHVTTHAVPIRCRRDRPAITV
jgi:hypothetical protein